MKTYLTLTAALALALALAACAANHDIPYYGPAGHDVGGVTNAPGSSQGQPTPFQSVPGVAKPDQAPLEPSRAATQEQPVNAFPLTINGPDGKAIAVIQADGTFQGDAGKFAQLLGVQKGGLPQENVLMALILHALREDSETRPKASQSPTGG